MLCCRQTTICSVCPFCTLAGINTIAFGSTIPVQEVFNFYFKLFFIMHRHHIISSLDHALLQASDRLVCPFCTLAGINTMASSSTRVTPAATMAAGRQLASATTVLWVFERPRKEKGPSCHAGGHFCSDPTVLLKLLFIWIWCPCSCAALSSFWLRLRWYMSCFAIVWLNWNQADWYQCQCVSGISVSVCHCVCVCVCVCLP